MSRCPHCAAYEGSDHHSLCPALDWKKKNVVFHRHGGVDYPSADECPKCWAQTCEIRDDQIKKLSDEIDRLRKGINAVYALIQESHGVAGLHLNGAIATWDELLLSSPPTAWLEDLAAVLPEPPA